MDEVRKLFQTIWDYMVLNQPIRQADVVVALGSRDLRTAHRAAELVNDRYGKWLVCSGAQGVKTVPGFPRPRKDRHEADVYAEVAAAAGVPESRILRESRSTNSQENISFTRRLIESKRLPHETVIFVHKPYMERRVGTIVPKVWPGRSSLSRLRN